MTIETDKDLGTTSESDLEILEFLLEEEFGQFPELPTIPRSSSSDPAPLSSSQQRLWFLSRLDPEASAYNMAAAVRIRGRLDVDVLERVINEIVQRHETLRSTIMLDGDEPVQRVAPHERFPLPVVDLSGLSGPEGERQARERLEREARQPFDLAQGPVFAFGGLRMSRDEFILSLNVHHVAADGWSMGILVQEVGALYHAFSTGRDSPLPELQHTYSDYARWQRLPEQQLAGESQLAYWRKQLADPPQLNLPTDHPRPARASYHGAHLEVAIAPAVLKKLRKLGVAHEATLFMTLQAAYCVLLARYAGQTDICVGTPVANRPLPELEPLVGFFVNTVVLRTDLQGDPTFAELLERVRTTSLDAYVHQGVPFERLVNELGVARDQSRAPLFQALFGLQVAPPSTAPQLPGLHITAEPLETGTSLFDLSLLLNEDSSGVSGKLEYNTDLFERPTATALVEHLQVILSSVAANPHQRISQVPLLSAADHQRLAAWNDTSAEFPRDSCIHELFQEQARRCRDKTAAAIGGKSLSYAELDARANRLAHRLRERGVGPDCLVGLCIEPSLEMLVGIWGILKSGGAYVPIDPDYPPDRLNFLLEDSGVTMVLTQASLRETLKEKATDLICLDEDWGEASYPPTPPATTVDPENLAYVIFTSGSTGRPKGVQISHRGLVNSNTARAAHYRRPRSFLLLSSFAFDSSVVGIFWTLCNGGTLHFSQKYVDPVAIVDQIRQLKISHLLCLPSLYELLLSSAAGDGLPSLEEAIVAGEVCPPGLAAKHREALPHAGLFNEGGVTEASVFSTIARVDQAAEATDCEASVSYGRAIANTQLYVLDRHLQPVPCRVPGELFIGGIGLARGYLRRAALTAERFLPDPFSSRPGARMYRTGDTVRWRSDGHLEFLGRIDHQVKIRGFRVETGEIEAALLQHPDVAQAAVLAVGEGGEPKRLVAYVVLDEALRHGQQPLAGPPPLELPTDHPRPAVAHGPCAAQGLKLSAELSSRLKQFAGEHDVSPCLLLLSAWQVLLSRYCRQDDIVVELTRADSRRAEAENLIGCRGTTQSVRSDFSENPRFADLLPRLRGRTLSTSEPARDLSPESPAQVMFHWEHAPRMSGEVGELADQPGPPRQTTLTSELTLVMGETDGRLTGAFEYRADLFERDTMERMAGSFTTLLESIVSQPECRLSDLPLLSAAERRQQLLQWNGTAKVFPQDKCIQQLFEQQVERTPTAVAVVSEDQELTYAELNARANQLAHYLRAAGVGPEVLVGLCVGRSAELVLGVLGILKAGGAYVPLDPNYPAGRLAYMLEDSQASMLLTQRTLLDRLPAHQAKLVCLDEDWPDVARHAQANPPCWTSPTNLANVIYTSGSTGKPKGSLITHANVVRLMAATEDWFSFSDTDVWTLFHSFAFDFSVWELCGALLYGGKLVVVPYWVSRSPSEFRNLLHRHQVTVLNQTPSAFYQLIAADEAATREHRLALRWVIFGGEALNLRRLGDWFERYGDRSPQLVNMYGITETTVHVTYRPLHKTDLAGRAASPIGVPIRDLQVYVVDPTQNLVPVGVPGELLVGGAGVARGYLNRPELTAERFICNPFDERSDSRLYRTGDLGRRLADGNLEFLGRADHQVKVRGFRVELGEIEAALLDHPQVREAVVLAHDDEQHGEKRLVAYLVTVAGNNGQPVSLSVSHLRRHLALSLPGHMIPATFLFLEALPLTPNGKLNRTALPAPEGDGHAAQATSPRTAFPTVPDAAPTSISSLRAHLLATLPAYMVPSSFVLLDEMPLNPNGKLDRQALPLPGSSRPDLDQAYVAPSTVIEDQLVQIWSELLGIAQVGVHDNFFELGGDSILSIQVVSRANRQGLRFTPRQLFEYQTIAELSRVAEHASPVEAEQGAVCGPVPLTPVQRWFFEQEHPEPDHFNQSVLLQVRADVDDLALEAVLNVLSKRHDALRLRFRRTPQGWYQEHSEAERPAPMARIDLTEFPAEQRPAALEQEATRLQASLSLAEGPLFRAALFDLGADGRRLLLIAHHLVVDGVSWRILLEDLGQAWRNWPANPDLGPKTSSYKDWSNRLVEVARTFDDNDELAYWQEFARRPATSVPRDGDGANTVESTQTVSISFAEQETRLLLQEVGERYHATINEVLLTALSQTLGKWTESDCTTVHLESHGREDESVGQTDTSRTVGWFTSMFPVALPADPTDVRATLRAVKESLRGTPSRGFSYGLLRYLPATDAVREILHGIQPAEIAFNYLGQFDNLLPADSAFAVAHESTGLSRSQRGLRDHLIEINAMVIDGRLQMHWSFGADVHRSETIEALAQDYLVQATALIEGRAAGFLGYTPADFPGTSLDQKSLDRVVDGRSDIAAIYPLTPTQAGMLFHSLYAPGSGVYVAQLTCEIAGTLSPHAFRQAWKWAIAKHEILRAAIVLDGVDRPLLRVQREGELPLDCQQWPGARQEAVEQQRLHAFLAADRQRGFDTAVAPLMRGTWIELPDARGYLVWSFHHILLDGWSVPMVLREVMEAYERFARGETPAATTTVAYASYIRWLGRQEHDEAEAFWKSHLAGFAGSHFLADAGRPEAASQPVYRQHAVTLSAETTHELEQFARREHLTLSSILTAAWSFLVSRYSGEDDVSIGVTVSGRPAELDGVERIVGMFINTLPLRTRIQENAAVLAWLKAVQSDQVSLNRYAASSLVDLQGWSSVPAGRPLFETIIVFENYPIESALAEPNRALRIVDVQNEEQANYPLAIVVVPGTQLTVKFAYDAGVCEPQFIARMSDHLGTLLASILTKSDQRLSDLSFVSDVELQQLDDWSTA